MASPVPAAGTATGAPAATAAAATASPTSTSSAIPVWFDCDPGHDDALALILAGYSSSLRVLGVSTVAGNQSIEKTTVNALNVLHVAALEHLPVFAGREQPILRKGVQCPEIHGVSGLEGPHFPPLTTHARPTKAFEAMRQAIQASGDAGAPVTILATGPLTNVALLLLTSPELASPSYIREIVLMGGAVGVGNTGPAAEFNIQVDPEAAHIVFESGLPVVMVPLEVTHTALVTPAVLARIRAIGSPFAAFICDLMLYFRDAYATVFGFSSPPLHDPCAVAFLLAPHMFETQLMRVDIDCESRLCYGRTVCDIYGRDARAKNVRVCLKMDVDQFWNLVLDALRQADQRSCLNQPQDGQMLYASKTEAEDAAAAAAAVPGQVAVETAGPRAVVLQNLPPRAGSS